MEPTIAFLASGSLFVKSPGHDVREIESPFALRALERQAKDQELHGWKSRSGVWGQMGMSPPEWSQWDEPTEARRQIAIRCVSRGRTPNEIYYMLDLGDVHGLFRYDLELNRESRLMHRNGFPARSFAAHPSGELVVALQRNDGSIGLAFSKNDGCHWDHLKGGDAADLSPAWGLDEHRRVVFQSAPIGRNQHGGYMGLGPFVLDELDLEDGDGSRTLLEDSTVDYLLPRPASDGRLYCIRRPYKPQGHDRPSFVELLQDFVFFPFRFVRALFYFFNFFSMMFTGRPLATSAGAKHPSMPQARYMALWGHMIDTKRALQKAARRPNRSLVPEDWELLCLAADGQETAIAQHVLAYDVCQDGGLVFTNGTVIFYRDAAGEIQKLYEHDFVDSVVVLE
jgi:hypothetical protein